MPDALVGRVIVRSFPALGRKVRVRLVPASATTGKCLLILRPANEPANGIGRVYVEYRTKSGWDRGMDIFGPDLSREGLVVHSVDLHVDPRRGPVAWYRGAVPSFSSDSDVSVASTQLVVAIDGVDPDRKWVDVSVSLGATHRVEILQSHPSDDFVGVIGELESALTPCGDSIRKGVFATSTTSEFSIRTAGFGGGGAPVATGGTITWTVGGVIATGIKGSISVFYGGTMFFVQYSIDPNVFTLRLTSRGGERFDAPVVVTVTENGTTATASTIFAAKGWFVGVHPEDKGAWLKCWTKLSNRYRRAPPVFQRPTPDPKWSLEIGSEIERLWYGQVVRLINQSPDLDASGRYAFRQLVDLQVQREPAVFGALAAVGIDFRLREADVTDWLTNQGSSYPVLSESLLTRLSGNRLRRPVYFDDIAVSFERLLGTPLPRSFEQVPVGVLETAVLEGSNARYGERVRRFAELLVVDDADDSFVRTRSDAAGEIWRMGRTLSADP